MSGVEKLWERLVTAALRNAHTGTDAYSIPGNVPSSLANSKVIDDILRVADEIQDEDLNVARILCEQPYSMAQNLDPNSEGRGILQFKTGIMSVIKYKLARREVGSIDRSQDIACLREFYRKYRDKHNVDQLMEDELKLRESANFGEIFRTLKVFGDVFEQMAKVMSREEAEKLIPEEVRAAVSALKDMKGLPKLPGDFVPSRDPDLLDFLQYIFGFQKDNVCNQREHVIHFLANKQSRLHVPDAIEPKLDEAAVQKVFLKSLENYSKWCNHLVLQPVWSNLESVSKEKKLLFISLYYLIWGEATNIRFLPKCLCYIFHHMAREMDEILRHQIIKQADSCKTKDGVSFLERVISPLYDVIAAEASNNDNGRARNYDDFNEYFWSLRCFELSWPWRLSSAFFMKPNPRSKLITCFPLRLVVMKWKQRKQ